MNILITGAGGQLGQDCCKVMGEKYTVHGRTSDQLDITQA
ncbi:MAG: dTDP-4-dehydrorhamnose reductase, partial [Candidatus Electrothrix sp. EH2]|nr:dTDP-4-dehydrorhamnose reductase [Candidatus Electrothrix sp. EH2]